MEFPIPLNSIEKFHFFDSQPPYPNLIFCRLLFDRALDRDRALQAWQSATARQPMSRSKISRRNGRLQWEHNPRHLEENDFNFYYHALDQAPDAWTVHDESTCDDHLSPYISIRTWPTDASQHSAQSELWIWGHHAVSDGAAAAAFVVDWLVAYENLESGRDVNEGMRPVDYQLMSRRNQLGLLSWKYLRYLPHQLVGLFGATKFIFRNIAAPVDDTPALDESSETSIYPAIESAWVDADGLRSLERDASRYEVSLNSLLMGELFRVLSDWRLSIDSNADVKDWIRIILPMNIRTISDRRLPAANRTSIVQIDRSQLESIPREALYRSIDREVKIIHGWQLDKMFLILVRVVATVESWLQTAVANEKSRGFAVFTNLNAVFRSLERKAKSSLPDHRSGSITRSIVEFDFVGPIRRGTPLNFAFGILGGRLRVSLHFDPRCVTRAEATRLLTQFVANLNSNSRSADDLPSA